MLFKFEHVSLGACTEAHDLVMEGICVIATNQLSNMSVHRDLYAYYLGRTAISIALADFGKGLCPNVKMRVPFMSGDPSINWAWVPLEGRTNLRI